MYLDVERSVALAKKIASFDIDGVELVVFSSDLAMHEVLDEGVKVGAQDGYFEKKGAKTGEVSMWDVSAAGAKYVLVGHSERRHTFGESNEVVAKKFNAALEAGLIPVLCIGETAEQKDSIGRDQLLWEQLHSALHDVPPTKIIIAYEPVWAIGTGKADDPEDIASAASAIKKILPSIDERWEVAILYGGSVKSDSIAEILAAAEIDGVLVGSASTKAGELQKMIKNI